MISGNSRLPTLRAMSEGEIVETATGVSRATATSITSDTTVISSNMSNKESAEADASCALKAKLAESAPIIKNAFFILFVKWLFRFKIKEC